MCASTDISAGTFSLTLLANQSMSHAVANAYTNNKSHLFGEMYINLEIIFTNIYHKLSFESFPESFFCVAVDLDVVVVSFI